MSVQKSECDEPDVPRMGERRRSADNRFTATHNSSGAQKAATSVIR